MISSNDVASLIMAQQQSLAASMQYATQSSNLGGIGSYGTQFMSPGMAIPQSQYLPHQAAGFNYNRANLTGYGLGNQVGAMGVSGMAGAFNGLNAGANIASIAGAFGLGPLRGLGMMGGLALGGAGMIGSHIMGSMVQGAQEQAGIYSTLGQFNFSNANSRTGRGFDRQNSKAIADFTREMAQIPEMMTSMSELNRIMGSLGSMGAMNGVRDAREFSRKFKENITALKDMAQIMQTSMEGALQYFQEAKRSGFYDARGMAQNTFNRQMTAGMTGMNQNQINQLQYSGSLMSFGMGGTRRSGANTALRAAQQVGIANEMGILSDERILELTGEEGGAGIASMAQTLTGAGYSMSRSSLGTAMALATGEVKNGRYTGRMDESVVKRIRAGGMSKGELLSMARTKASSRGAKISFASQRGKITAEMASAVGVEGIAIELKSILGEHGWKNEDALNLVMQRYHMDEREAQTVIDYMKKLPEIQEEIGLRGQTEARRIAEQSYMNENFSPTALKQKLGTKISNITSGIFKKIGADLSHSMSSYVDNFIDDFLERQSVQITKEVSHTLAGGLAGGAIGKAGVASDIGNIISSYGNMGNRGADFSTGTVSRLLADASDSQTKGMLRYNTLSRESSEFSRSRSKKFLKAGTNTYGETNSFLSTLNTPFFGLLGDRTREVGDYLSQDQKQNEAWASGLRQLNDRDDPRIAGMLGQSRDFLGQTIGAGLDEGSEYLKEILSKNRSKLRKMSQEERMDFIRGQIGISTIGTAVDALKKKGVGFSAALAYMQRKAGVMGDIGSVDFSKLANEAVASIGSNFGSVGGMAKLIKDKTDKFADQFGDNKEKVKALMGTDSKARELFLKAADGDADAIRLLKKENLTDNEKEDLMHKFGIKDHELEHLQDLWGGASGAVTGGRELKIAIQSGAYAGAAKQLRDSGRDISDRLTASGLANVTGPPTRATAAISKLAKSLTGITSLESLRSFVSSGGDIHEALSAVGSLKGKDRDKYMSILGGGAQAAFDAQNRFLKTGAISDNLLEDEDIKKFIGGRSIKSLSKKEKEELGEKIRDRTFTGGLAYKGQVQAKDFQSELMGKLNEFARTSTQFAQLVIDATPTLANNVKEAAQRHGQAGEKLSSNPNDSMSGG